MRNIVSMFLVVFILLSAGGYVILWYAQASSTKRHIEAFIEKVNEKQKYITYESIETSGFPSNVFVSLVKPRFKGRVDQIVQALDPKAAPRAIWDEDAILDGRITVGINALSDRYSLSFSGNWSQSSTIAGQSTASLHQLASDITCNLQMERGLGIFDTLWNFSSLARDGKALAEDFRMLDCNSAGHKSTDAASKEVLTSVGGSRLYITQTPQQGITQYRVYAKITDAEVSPAADSRILAAIGVLSPGYTMPIKYSDYGKQNIDVDFTYYGPADLKAEGKNPAIDVALNKLDFTNSIYNYHMNFHVNNTPSGDTRSSQLSFKAESSFSEKYDLFVQDAVRTFIEQASTMKDPKYENAQQWLKQYPPDQLYSIIYPAIPSFHALGKLLVSLDGSFKGSADLMNGDYALNVLEISSNPYGIVGKGNLHTAPAAMPTGNIQLSCSNCLQLIDDLVAYSARVQQIMVYFNPQRQQSYAIDPAQAAAVKQFLTLLAVPQKNPADRGTLAYSITSTGHDVNINGKNMADVMRLYNEYVKPTLKQQSPVPQAAPN